MTIRTLPLVVLLLAGAAANAVADDSTPAAPEVHEKDLGQSNDDMVLKPEPDEAGGDKIDEPCDEECQTANGLGVVNPPACGADEAAGCVMVEPPENPLPPEQQTAKVEGMLAQPGGVDKVDKLIGKIDGYVARQSGSANANDKRLKQIEEQLRMLTEAAKKKAPNDPKVLSLSAQQALRGGNAAQALADSKRALMNGAKDGKTYTTYAAASFQLGDHATASQAAALALQADPSNKQALAIAQLAHATLGANVSIKDKTDPSRDEAAPAPRLPAGTTPTPGSPGQAPAANPAAAMTSQAANAFTMKDYTTALDLATKATALDPADYRAWNIRSFANLRLKRYAEAVKDATQTLSLNPGNTEALQARGWAYSRQRQYREALADADAALERDPYNGYHYQNRAYAQAGLGDRKGALDSLKQSAQEDPQFLARFEEALQAPESNDLLYLFDEGAIAPPPWKTKPPSPWRKVAPRALIACSAVFLIIAGVKIFSRSEPDDSPSEETPA